MDLSMFDILIAVVFLAYGIRFLKNPPAFEDKNGISTKMAKKSKAIWAYTQHFAGIYCIVCGIICGIIVALDKLVFQGELTAIKYVQFAVEAAMVVVLYPLVNFAAKKRFPTQQ